MPLMFYLRSITIISIKTHKFLVTDVDNKLTLKIVLNSKMLIFHSSMAYVLSHFIKNYDNTYYNEDLVCMVTHLISSVNLLFTQQVI